MKDAQEEYKRTHTPQPYFLVNAHRTFLVNAHRMTWVENRAWSEGLKVT